MMLWIRLSPVVIIRNGRPQIEPVEFKGYQKTLMQFGAPEDPCGRCGCQRKHHLPGYMHTNFKWRIGQKDDVVPTCAPTSCDCKYCICSCVAFVEPFEGQKFLHCIYDPAVV